MKLKFEKGKKKFISNDGLVFDNAEVCIEHEIENLYGKNKDKCSHSWVLYHKENKSNPNTQFNQQFFQSERIFVGKQCNICGKTSMEYNIDFMGDVIKEADEKLSDTDMQELLNDLYNFVEPLSIFYFNKTSDNKQELLDVKNNFKKMTKWLRALLKKR
jgi:hypothetical protein